MCFNERPSNSNEACRLSEGGNGIGSTNGDKSVDLKGLEELFDGEDHFNAISTRQNKFLCQAEDS